jgi:hypothetical protein
MATALQVVIQHLMYILLVVVDRARDLVRPPLMVVEAEVGGVQAAAHLVGLDIMILVVGRHHPPSPVVQSRHCGLELQEDPNPTTDMTLFMEVPVEEVVIVPLFVQVEPALLEVMVEQVVELALELMDPILGEVVEVVSHLEATEVVVELVFLSGKIAIN